MWAASSWCRALCGGKALQPLSPLLCSLQNPDQEPHRGSCYRELAVWHGRQASYYNTAMKIERLEGVLLAIAACPVYGQHSSLRIHSAGIDNHCRYVAMRQLQQARSAATVLQAHWRGRAARQATKRIRAAITLQRFARGAAVRRALARQHGAAVAIQSAWRQRQAMRRYARDVRDITSAQASRTLCRVGWQQVQLGCRGDMS